MACAKRNSRLPSNSRQETRTGNNRALVAIVRIEESRMKRLAVASFVAVVVMLTAWPQAAARSMPASGVTALNTFLSGQVSRGGIPGVVAMVVSRDAVL